jgi:hypothetical protein
MVSKINIKATALFLLDQISHLIVIIFVWCNLFSLEKKFTTALLWPIYDYKASLIILGYAIVV